MTRDLNLRRHVRATSSWSVIGLLIAAAPSIAFAQEAANQEAAPESGQAVEAEPAATDSEIVVVGSRASQQSAINRKRNARTATDSIVADDIGSFPDRNVNEAISRVAGVALNRNEFGEGSGVAIRGNGPDLTRVELDGIGIQSTNNLAIDGTGSRGADLRELPAELIKSVDVVKGSTADMTEGSLGGGVQIRTRSGLDFNRPYVMVRGGVGQNSLGKEWTPDVSGVAAGRLLGDRLGVIVSGTYSKIQNNNHGYENTTSGNRGYARLFDFDQSPEKTFTYNPATVGTDAADVAFANSTAPDGTSLTPRELVTLAAGATSKAQCLEIFPHAAATAAAAVRSQRILEQQSCLNQWNDYTPSLIRHFMSTQTEERLAFDGRLDFQVTDNLTVYAKGTYTDRTVDDQFRSRTPISLFNQNVAGSFVTTGAPGNPRRRAVSPNAPAGYYLIDSNYGINAGAGADANFAVLGNVLNVIPSSVVVDDLHNVTQMTLTNNTVSIDQIDNLIESTSKFAQAGAEYRGERLEIDAMAGLTTTSTRRGDMRTSRGYLYGDATLTLQPNGLWDIDLPANYDETNPANFVQPARPACVAGGTNPATCIGQNAVAASPTGPATPQYLVSQMPLTTPTFAVQYSPRLGESDEKIAKLDLGYDTEGLIPFINRVKVGAMYRDNNVERWGAGGYTVSSAVGTFGQPGYVPAVVVPISQVRGSYRACEPTPGSSAPGGLSCNYGFVPSTNPSNVRSGVDTLTPDELRALLAATLEAPENEYFADLPNRGNLPPAWQGIDTSALFDALGASQFMNFDCIITCTGSDGKTYAQPVTRVRERTKNVYAMFDFEQPLPLGLLFNGNVGVRGVFRDVHATGLQTITAIRTTGAFNPATPDAPAGIISQSFSQLVDVKSSTTEWLPSVNLNLWAFDEKVVFRLYGGKTSSPPSVNNLVPGGTCIIDQRDELDGDTFGCTGRVGNPNLAPFSAWNYNASLEWYPNPDTLFSVAYGELDVKVGNAIQVTEIRRPFAGSDATDPISGEPLADYEFSVPTWANGPGYKRDIWEFSAKTAFTFLPWFLKYTGADANVSILSSAATSGQQDPLTGDVMLPPDESKYYWNASLWYDDGKLNLRAAWQKRSARFSCITPCGGNNIDTNYPGEQWTNVRLVAPGYNPGVPRFNDGTTFIDLKASYNFNSHFQVYVEGRNIMREVQTISTGSYERMGDDIPRIMRLNYSGRRVMLGMRVQFGGN
jgi:TonB-dependent receptor